jgi:hypothetical protein
MICGGGIHILNSKNTIGYNNIILLTTLTDYHGRASTAQ